MKKKIFLTFVSALALAPDCFANEQSARQGAADLLSQKPKAIEIDTRKLPADSRTDSAKSNTRTIQTEDMSSAPFGLAWGANEKSLQRMGVALTPSNPDTGLKNSFEASSLPKPIADFPTVELVFNEKNELARIISYTNRIEEDNNASKVLFLYNKYYKLLDNKYGNAEQFYTPKITIKETIVELEKGKTETTVEEIKEEIGNANFLEQLKSKEASLFSIFESDEIGAVLTVYVDEEGKSFLAIDYKNLNMIKKQEENILDAL